MLEIKLKQSATKGLDHWEEVFGVLEEETFSLFKDQAAVAERTSRWPPISMVGAVCRETVNRRKEHTFKLTSEDGTQYLFAASSRELQQLWIKTLQNAPKSASSDSDDSGRASSVNVSLEKLAEAPDDPASARTLDRRSESLDRHMSTDGSPPPKPPHTYYNKHRFQEEETVRSTGSLSRHSTPPSEAPPPPPDTSDPPAVTPQGFEDASRPRKNVFRKFFTKK